MSTASQQFPSDDLFQSDIQESQSNFQSPGQYAPLAARMRPKTLDDVMGQEHILGPGKILRRTIESDKINSILFYGPPGCGKTTLARVISRLTESEYHNLNAVDSSVADLRKIVKIARANRQKLNKNTILFVDEIHRFNKAQQDVLMPDVEERNLILIGATTQNPYFSINSALISRSSIFELKPLEDADLVKLMRRALSDKENGYGDFNIEISDNTLSFIARHASGDARKALGALEIGVASTEADEDGIVHFNQKVAEESCQKKAVYHDRDGDYHYDVASAFIKSMRGSDPDASLFWLAKMLEGGEEPRFILRRMIILASEDIGNADPQALVVATSALQALEFVGMPEGRIILGQVVTYLASAPKSNASYLAIDKAIEDVQNVGEIEVPTHLKDKHYPGAKKMGRGEGYIYPHNYPYHYVPQKYMPHEASYYEPTDLGEEKNIKRRLDFFKSQKRNPSKD